MRQFRNNLKKVLISINTFGFLFAFLLSAHAATPEPLPVPENLPPCLFDVVPAQAPAVFPCSAILFSENDAIEVADAGKAAGATVRFEYHSLNAVAVVVNDSGTLQILAADPILQFIPDRHLAHAPPPGKGKNKDNGGNDGQVVPSGVTRIGAGPGQLTVSGQGVGVAVLDTGIDFSHADLAAGSDCFDAFGGDCSDLAGHGTHVSGIIAALDNDIDVVGVAPQATPYAVKVLNDSGSGSDSTLMYGLDWITQNADQVVPAIKAINMSLGRPGNVDDNPALHALIQVLHESGVTIVVSAGNDPDKEASQFIPAAYAEVLRIASSTAEQGGNRCRQYAGQIDQDTASYFTTDGAGVTVTAPGNQKEDINQGCRVSSSGILSLATGGGTTRMSGTSMAAPHVSGVVALIYANGQLSDPEAIRSAIVTGADRAGDAPLDSPTVGYSFDGVREGILSACGALGLDCP